MIADVRRALYLASSTLPGGLSCRRCRRPRGVNSSRRIGSRRNRKRGEPAGCSRGCYPVKKAWVESRRDEHPFAPTPTARQESPVNSAPPAWLLPRHLPLHLLVLACLFVFSRPRSTKRTRRPVEATVSEERERRPEQHESLRTTIGHRRRSTAARRGAARTNERDDDERTSDDATFSHGMLACFEYVNIFYSTLSLGRGIKLFPPRGCRRRSPHRRDGLNGVPMPRADRLVAMRRINAEMNGESELMDVPLDLFYSYER